MSPSPEFATLFPIGPPGARLDDPRFDESVIERLRNVINAELGTLFPIRLDDP